MDASLILFTSFTAILMLGHKDELVLQKDGSNRVYENMVMIPDLDTIHPIPWAGSGTFKVCDFYYETAGLSNLQSRGVSLHDSYSGLTIWDSWRFLDLKWSLY